MQFLWQFDNEDSIFCHHLLDHYSAPISVDHWWETFEFKDYVYGDNINNIAARSKAIKNYVV